MNLEQTRFFDSVNIGITVSDTEGRVLYMNDKSQSVFGSMVGSSMMGCHKEESQAIIRRLIAEAGTNAYTIEKKGVRKLIYQTPWYEDGRVAGLVEFSIVLPETMPHYVREAK
jgi:transcriptional regulator with PAS, ATPase and Fis domain